MTSETNPRAGGIRRLGGPDVGWIGVQVALLAVGGPGGLIEWLARGRGFVMLSGATSALFGAGLLLLAALVFVRSARDLAGNLTMSPTPVEDGHLVENGIYGVVRHPMYLGLMLSMAGYTLLIGSWLALSMTVVLVPFLFAKSRHEERLLRSRFPEYDGYARRVRRRFIPRVL